MAVPRHRTSNARKKSRRAHHALKKKEIAVCNNCGQHILPHRICSGCGIYKERSYSKESE